MEISDLIKKISQFVIEDRNDKIEHIINLHVEDVIYDISRTQINNKFPFGDLIRFYRLPKEYKYLHRKKWEYMTSEEQAVSYRSIPAARLTEIN
jgi:hypothetical protein